MRVPRILAQRLQVLRGLGEQVRRAIEPERRLAVALQLQAPGLLDVGNRQGDLIELPIGRVRLEVQLHLFAIGDAPGLQAAHTAVELARQHGLFTGATLKYNSSPSWVSALKCTLAGANIARVRASCSTL